jgi:hypothetical protein
LHVEFHPPGLPKVSIELIASLASAAQAEVGTWVEAKADQYETDLLLAQPVCNNSNMMIWSAQLKSGSLAPGLLNYFWFPDQLVLSVHTSVSKNMPKYSMEYISLVRHVLSQPNHNLDITQLKSELGLLIPGLHTRKLTMNTNRFLHSPFFKAEWLCQQTAIKLKEVNNIVEKPKDDKNMRGNLGFSVDYISQDSLAYKYIMSGLLGLCDIPGLSGHMGTSCSLL